MQLTPILAFLALCLTAQARDPPARCRAPISPLEVGNCCRDFQIACLSQSSPCTTFTQIANVSPLACQRGLTCVLFDLGLIAADVPNKGTCMRLSRTPPVCSVAVCAATGADTVCRQGAQTVTCRAYATLDAPDGPDCAFACTLECLIDGPFASDGRQFCTECQLRGASCASGFEIFGPVPRPPTTTPPTTRPPVTTSPNCRGNSENFTAECCALTGRCIPEGEKCTRSGFFTRPVPCQRGLTCVLDDFGNPRIDQPDSGTCRLLPSTPPPCTVDLCARTGAATICTVRGVPATCVAWATSAINAPDCNAICTAICLEPRVVASNGQEFCSPCVLAGASCLANFSFFGPVSGGPRPGRCGRNIPPAMAAKCCEDFNVGCVPAGEACSTAGSRIRPVPCRRGLTCVISDFGFPAVDRPNAGVCRNVRVGPNSPRKCTVNYCSRRGASALCTLSDIGGITSCGAWATRSDGGMKPSCDFGCRRGCVPRSRRPVATNGRRFCNFCTLRKASCSSGFTVYRRD